MGQWEAFEEDRDYVLGEFRKGFLDYAEVLSHVAETRFFEFLLGDGHLEALADTYPTPRKKEEVPLAVYIASELTLRLHGATGFSAYPFVIHAGGLKEALRQAQVNYDGPGGRARLSCAGYNKKNDYSRETPCHHDFLRKLARQTKAASLVSWFAHAVPKLYQTLGMIDEEGILIADGSHLFVPDNEGYEGSAVGFFDEHNQFVKDPKALTPDELKRCRYRRYYTGVSLLHTNRAQTCSLYVGQRVLWKAESENPPLGAMVEDAVSALGRGRIKILIHDKGFIDGERTAHFKEAHGIDSVFPLKAGMLDWEDAKRLAAVDGRPWQVWRPPPPAVRPEPPQRPESIRRRERRRQETLRRLKEQSPDLPPARVDRVELKAIRDMKLWDACRVPIHVVLLREFRTDGKISDWALATTRDFEDPLEIWNFYKMRPSIEEKHRQMKCFWDLTRFCSRAYSLVVNQVIFMALAYSLMQIFLIKVEREELTGATRRRLLEQLLPDGQKISAYRDNYVGYFTPLELLSETLELSEGPRRRLIGTVRRLCRSALTPPSLPLRS
jgi:hypothetical protein